MKLLIIRHADPDYSIDNLTPIGKIEAEMLSERLVKTDIKAYYVSPLGRAQATIAPTLAKLGRTATTLDWLREFPITVVRGGDTRVACCWDWLPEVWTKEEDFYDRNKWFTKSPFAEAGVAKEYKKVTDGLDALLAKHGYEREGGYYKATAPNEDTIALVCHFGLGSMLISHLIGVSPMVIWHGFCAAPSSVTTINTEERKEGIASFRIASFGDTTHLYVNGREPSFSARFCETYANKSQRHD